MSINEKELKEVEDDLRDVIFKTYFLWIAHDEFPTDKDKEFEKELGEKLKDDFCVKVLKKKIEAFNIPIKINSYLYALLSLISDNNPGRVQLLLLIMLEYLSKNKPIPKNYEIKCVDFTNAFNYESANLFDSEEFNNMLVEKWEAQKKKDYIASLTHSDNMVDYPEYWLRFFE
jgi:hypothetical protein